MNSFKHSLTYGVAALIVGIAISIGLYALDMMESPLRWLTIIAFVILQVLGLKTWRDKENVGIISYGKAFGYGMWMILFFSFFMAIWVYIMIQYIAHDEFVRNQSAEIAKRMEMMRTEYKLSEADIERGMKKTEQFRGTGVAAMVIFVLDMAGLTIVNLIVAAIMKKDPPPPAPAAYPPTNTFSA